MNTKKRDLLLLLIIISFILLFKYNYIIQESVLLSFQLWITKVFPSLFIFFIINDFIINNNLLNNKFKYLSKIFSKIYNVSDYSFIIFILSIISGTPTSALIITESLNNNLINENDANKLISFTYFPNPLFLYNILSLSFNNYITWKLIIIHYTSNLIIGLFYKRINYKSNFIKLNKVNNKYNISLSINKSFNTLLMILSTITFYMIISNIIIKILNTNILFNILIKGLLEITQGLNLLQNINTKNIIKETIALAIISFGGISIHSQISYIISDYKIKYKNFFIGRILHIIISFILNMLVSL